MSVGVAVGLLVAFFLGRFTWFRLRAGRARAMVAAGADLIDVRSANEFSAGHLPEARNWPLDRLLARPGDLGPKDRALVVYCRSGARSAMAASALRRAGYTTVVNLGPMSAW
jgi:rhodanese-related sulfurtransferase